MQAYTRSLTVIIMRLTVFSLDTVRRIHYDAVIRRQRVFEGITHARMKRNRTEQFNEINTVKKVR